MYLDIIHFILAEYADLSACTTFVSGVNIQASNQLASCEGVRVVIVCDVNDGVGDENQEVQSSSQSDKILSNLKSVSKAISLYGMYFKRKKKIFS